MAKIAIVKKTKGSFKRHHHDRYARLSRSSHRHQRGIDSCVRRRYRGKAAQPKIGYGSNKKTKHLMPNGYRRLVVSNSKDVELLLMCVFKSRIGDEGGRGEGEGEGWQQSYREHSV